MFRLVQLNLLIWTACLATQAAEDMPIGGMGYRYDGTGLAPSSWTPPSGDIDPSSGKGIRWKVPTANWGYACPVEIGNQVLVLCEAGTEELVWPTLVSRDRTTGAVLWKTAIDPLLAHGVDDASRQQIEEDWAYFHEIWRFLYSTANGYGSATEAERQAINEKLKSRQFDMKSYKKGYGLLRYLQYNNERFLEVKSKYAKSYGLRQYAWQNQGAARVGAVFPTPVTDGKHIIVITEMGTVTCLDMTGKIRWSTYTGYKVPGHAGTGSSPRIADGKALFSLNSKTWAYDLESGAEVWTVGQTKDKWYNGHGVYASPVVMDLNGTLVLIDGKSRVIRISDGHVLKLVDSSGAPVKGKVGKKNMESDNMIANPSYLPYGMDRDKQILFIAGKSHFAQFKLTPYPNKFGKPMPPSLVGYQLHCEGETVTVVPTKVQIPGGQGGVALGNKLYLPGQIVDRSSLEGAGSRKDKKVKKQAPDTRHIFMLANGHTYGMKAQYIKGSPQTGCDLQIYTTDGKQTASIILPWIDPATDSNVQKAWDQGISSANYACSFNLGRDCIYVRDNAYLYCLGH